MSMAASSVPLPNAIVAGWLEAFNSRKLDEMLARLSVDVDFRPLRLSGMSSAYRGHDGVRDWFEAMESLGYDCQIANAEIREMDNGWLLVSGTLTVGVELAVGPVSEAHLVDGNTIVTARQYLSDAELIERLGLLR
jgi:hypothetical protein